MCTSIVGWDNAMHSAIKHLRLPVELVAIVFVGWCFHLQALTIKASISPKGRTMKEEKFSNNFIHTWMSACWMRILPTAKPNTLTHHYQMKGKTPYQNETKKKQENKKKTWRREMTYLVFYGKICVYVCELYVLCVSVY